MFSKLKIAGFILLLYGIFVTIYGLYSTYSYLNGSNHEDIWLSLSVKLAIFLIGIYLIQVGLGIAKSKIKFKRLGFSAALIGVFVHPSGIIFGLISILFLVLGRDEFNST